MKAVEDILQKHRQFLEETYKRERKNLIAKATSGNVLPMFRQPSIDLSEIDKQMIQKMNKNELITISHIAYCFKTIRKEAQKVFLEAAIEVFKCFEKQFMEATCKGGEVRAMQKLAEDCAHRAMTYLSKFSIENEITSESVIKGVLEGPSMGKTLDLKKPGRTLMDLNKKEWKSGEMFGKVGVCFIEGNKKYYFKCDKSRTCKYGHRLLFNFEILGRNWTRDTCQSNYSYKLIHIDEDKLFLDLWKHVFDEEYEDDKLEDTGSLSENMEVFCDVAEPDAPAEKLNVVAEETAKKLRSEVIKDVEIMQENMLQQTSHFIKQLHVTAHSPARCSKQEIIVTNGHKKGNKLLLVVNIISAVLLSLLVDFYFSK